MGYNIIMGDDYTSLKVNKTLAWKSPGGLKSRIVDNLFVDFYRLQHFLNGPEKNAMRLRKDPFTGEQIYESDGVTPVEDQVVVPQGISPPPCNLDVYGCG